MAGQKLARAAHTRPTTVTAQAAVWGREGSEEVLDWLGVSERVYPLEDPAEAPIAPETLVPETPSAALNETRVPAPGCGTASAPWLVKGRPTPAPAG